VLQLIAYPILARHFSGNDYGVMITIFSVVSLVSGTLGGELCNIRLLKDQGYKARNTAGDFNVLLLFYSLATTLILFAYCLWAVPNESGLRTLLVIVFSVLSMVNTYLDAAFRLKLNFKQILLSRLITSAGYGVGLLLAIHFSVWELMFVTAQSVCFLYLIFRTDLLKEPFVRTVHFRDTLKECTFLQIAGALLRAMTYTDRILLYPLLGGATVSVYYTSTLLGKIIVMGLVPVSTVLLSYIVKINRITDRTFRNSALAGAVVCAVGYVLIFLISRPVLTLLFPQWADEAMRYVPITTLSTCIFALCTLLTPFVMKVCNLSWQIVINGISLAVFLGSAYILFYQLNLLGWCIGITIGYAVRLLLILIVYNVKGGKYAGISGGTGGEI
jgi:O-antigen/teichoic acid export membrane protein